MIEKRIKNETEISELTLRKNYTCKNLDFNSGVSRG